MNDKNGWWVAQYRYDNETIESPARIDGENIRFFGDALNRSIHSDRVTLLFRIPELARITNLVEADHRFFTNLGGSNVAGGQDALRLAVKNLANLIHQKA